MQIKTQELVLGLLYCYSEESVQGTGQFITKGNKTAQSSSRSNTAELNGMAAWR